MLTGCSGKAQTSSVASSENDTTGDSVTDGENENENIPQIQLNESVVKLSAESGVYESGFSLELSCDDSDTIYYTTDGSDPRTSDTRIAYSGAIEIGDRSGEENVVSAVDPALFSGNFNRFSFGDRNFVATVKAPDKAAVDKCTVIRACSEAEDGSFSQSFSGTYFIGSAENHIDGLKESCEASGSKLAVMSITMNYDDLFYSEKGIYVKGNVFQKALEEYFTTGESIEAETARKLDANYKQKGKAWERGCHIDLFEFGADSAEIALSQDCGIRIQGNYSRSDLQKGFRLFARKDYGDNKFRYPVFGDELKNSDGENIDTFKSLVLRAGGNCAFTSKFNDTYWQTVCESLDCSTKKSRPCVVYLNGEYWGLYVLEEDYSDNYFEDHYGVDKDSVVIYKGDAEKYACGYYLDEGKLPDGESDEGYFYRELFDFFGSHKNLKSAEDYEEFSKLVDVESVKDYFLAEVWINNKWDWPGKNWSMWKASSEDSSNEYGDGRWRFMFYDMEFGGVSGEQDASTNTVKEDNYKPLGLLDMDTNNPAVLCFAYLMTNEEFRNSYTDELSKLSENVFEKERLLTILEDYEKSYGPLFDQFFARYPKSGSTDEAINGGYASVACIKSFIGKREKNIEKIISWINKQF